MYKITTPKTTSDFNQYFLLRWELLRKPWDQKKGSERDDLENVSEHRMVVIDGDIVAVARLHYLNETVAQIRYMAVRKEFEHRGIGKALYTALEDEVRNNKTRKIILHAREPVIGFYEKLGFTVIKKSHVLFNQVQHFEMHKRL